MIVRNMTEFRVNMKNTLDKISENHEPVIISRSGDRDVIILSLSQYNSMRETLYLVQSEANRSRLDKAVADVRVGKNLVFQDLYE